MNLSCFFLLMAWQWRGAIGAADYAGFVVFVHENKQDLK
jgi:hypothetical protein